MRASPRPRWVLWVTGLLVVWSCLNGLALALVLLEDEPADSGDVLQGVLLTSAGLVLAWLAWRPTRPADPDPLGTAVARPAWWLRLGGLLAAVIAGGLALNLWEVARGATSLDGLGRVAVAALLALVVLVLLLAAWVTWWSRQTVDPGEATTRLLLGTSRIDRAAATAVRVTTVTVHAGRAGGRIPVGRVVVEGPNQRGIPARAGFDPTMTDVEQALAVLDLWVRERPALVQDDATRALFEARGALAGPGGD